MCPKFQVYRDTAGKTRFRLRADNNQIVAVGEAYDHQACIKAITSILRNRNAAVQDLTVNETSDAPNPKFEVYLNEDNRFRFCLRGVDGGVIAQGEAYDTKQACLNAIEVIRYANDASIEDPFVTEIVIDAELQRRPDITMNVIKPTGVVIRLGDQSEKQRLPSFPVVSLFTLLSLEFAMGLTEGVMNAVGGTRQATIKSVAANLK
jgi:uncharacterized protein YegP (UPF0339 family)